MFLYFLFWKEWDYDLLFMKVNIDVQSGYYLNKNDKDNITFIFYWVYGYSLLFKLKIDRIFENI